MASQIVGVARGAVFRVPPRPKGAGHDGLGRAEGGGAGGSRRYPVGDWTYGISMPASRTGLRPVPVGAGRWGRRGLGNPARVGEPAKAGSNSRGAGVYRRYPVGDWTYGLACRQVGPVSDRFPWAQAAGDGVAGSKGSLRGPEKGLAGGFGMSPNFGSALSTAKPFHHRCLGSPSRSFPLTSSPARAGSWPARRGPGPGPRGR